MLGAEHAATLDTMGNFANFLQETGRFEKAESLHRRGLDIRRRLQGEKAPSTVSEMNNLANDIASLGRFEEAKALMERTLQLKIELYGEAHPSTLNSVSNLADLEDDLGHPVNAEALHRRALDGRMRALGATHERTLYSRERLANTLSTMNRFADAERLAATAAAQATESLGERRVTTLAAQDTRGLALIGLRRADEAEPILRRQLTILAEKKKMGEDAGEGDELSARLRVHLGMALASLGRRTEAETLLVEAIPQLPPKTADTTRAVRFLVGFYDDWNRSQPDAARSARASEWRRRLESPSGSTGRLERGRTNFPFE